MRLLFVWTGLTGYMADCWRALQRRPGVELKVLVEGEGLGAGFSDAVMQGLDWERVAADSSTVVQIAAWRPDAIVVIGWRRKLSRLIAGAAELERVPKFMQMDMPWEWSLRKIAARFVLWRHCRRFRGILVHGERGARYARWLGFAPEDIHRGCAAAVDLARFAAARTDSPRTGFLFVGRKAAEKGLDFLRAGYARYREKGGTWALDVPEWIEPGQVPAAMAAHACLVLPSRREPFGMVVLEAIAVGMRTVVSDRVGARLEVPVDRVVRFGDAEALANALLAVERQGGGGAAPDISFWDCRSWAERIASLCANA